MNTIAMFSGQDMLIIFLIVLLLFGAKKLPELAKGMGQAVREFNKAKDEIQSELTKTTSDLSATPAPNRQEYIPAPSTQLPAQAPAPAPLVAQTSVPAAPAAVEVKPKEETTPQVSTQQLL